MKKKIGVITIIVLITTLTGNLSFGQNILESGHQSNLYPSSLSSTITSASYLPNTYIGYYNPELLAQDTVLTYRIITNDGNEFIGTMVEQDAQKITLNTLNLGVITIQKLNIKSMTLIEAENIKGLRKKYHVD